MIRIIAKLFVAAALTPLLLCSPAAALPPQVAYVSATGSDSNNTCTTVAQPCATVGQAALQISPTSGGVVSCIGGTGPVNNTGGIELTQPLELTIDCPGGTFLGTGSNPFDLQLTGANQILKIRHLTFDLANIASGASAILVQGSGNLILEDCVFENGSGVALNITPNGPLNLVIKNSRISNSAAGILLQPAAGGSINATLDHVVITGNTGTGGGIKSNSADGIVNLDITESEISYNGGVGVNGRSGGFLNMVSINNSVITKNGAQGVQANGANVGITVQTTLLDQNTGGATSIEAGGHISTYGNNSIIGPSGSGFTGTASLQ
jgi:hypothetical protein